MKAEPIFAAAVNLCGDAGSVELSQGLLLGLCLNFWLGGQLIARVHVGNEITGGQMPQTKLGHWK